MNKRRNGNNQNNQSGFRPIESKDSSESRNKGGSLESLLNSEHTVKIEKLAVGGDAVARINVQDRSIVVFVKLGAPGDQAKIRIVGVEKTFLRAEITELIEASGTRRVAPCGYFPTCGGCTWQHVTELEQVSQKELILKELLQKFVPNKTYTLVPSFHSPKSFNYRNRIQLKHVNDQLGYFKRESHDIVDINYCLIADKIISDQIPPIKMKLRPAKELQKYELKLNQKNDFEYYKIGEAGEGLSFSQVNNDVNAELARTVTSLVANDHPTMMTELYAGAGNFTFSLLGKLPSLVIESVEMNPDLTKFSTQKLTALGLQKRLFAFTSDCESFVVRRPLSKDLILLDPPRSGCSDVVLKKVIDAKPKNILYISCHPVFLARDLQKLFNAHPEYKISHLQIFDMFPQTDHFETLIYLTL